MLKLDHIFFKYSPSLVIFATDKYESYTHTDPTFLNCTNFCLIEILISTLVHYKIINDRENSDKMSLTKTYYILLLCSEYAQ